MKKLLVSFLMLFLAMAVALSQQSLGDAARKARAEKKAPATVVIEGEGTPQMDNQPQASSESTSPDARAADKGQVKKSAAELDKQKTDDWNAKIAAQKKDIALLQRELDVVEREQRLRAAAFYADAGVQLRDQAKYAEDSRKEQEQIDTKKKALGEAQQKLDDLQEQARKAGAKVSD